MDTPFPPSPGDFPLHDDEIDGAFDEFGNPIEDGTGLDDGSGFDEFGADLDPALDDPALDDPALEPAGFGAPARRPGGFGGPRPGGFGRSGFESRPAPTPAQRANSLVERLLKRF